MADFEIKLSPLQPGTKYLEGIKLWSFEGEGEGIWQQNRRVELIY